MHQGYILTSESLDIQDRHEIHLSGTGPEGPFFIKITDNKPVFFVPGSLELPPFDFSLRKPVQLTSYSGESVDALYFDSLHQFFGAKEKLTSQGCRVYESDVYPSERFLMERFITGAICWDGPGRIVDGGTLYVNPRISAPEEGTSSKPELRVLSLDIETGQQGEVYSIAMHGTGYNCVLKDFKKVLIHSDHKSIEGDFQYCQGEKETLKAFQAWIRKWDPDIIIGWYVIGFDLTFLENRFRHFGEAFLPGRENQPLKIKENRAGFFSAECRGRQIIDGLQTMRQNFYKFENFKLETVAQELLGRGKDIEEEGVSKVEEIERRYKEDPAALARYNLEDCILVSDIFKKTDLLGLILARREMTGLPLDQVNRTVAAFDFFYLPRLHRHGLVAPDSGDVQAGESASGGYVFAGEPGLYEQVIVLDFKSLYPSLIRTFHIDPLALIQNGNQSITTPTGHSFSKTETILPDFLAEAMNKRKKAKEEHNEPLSQAVKILMNSFYGAMGTTACRFYNPDLPKAITGTGQWILKETVQWLRGEEYKVIYGDTDSVFICLKKAETHRPEESGLRLAERVNHFIGNRVMEISGVFSHLEIEYEKLYRKFFLPPLRGSETGARKRYAGLLVKGGIENLEFTGMEFVRSDWTEMARNFQYELYRQFFHNEDAQGWIKQYMEDLRSGKMDDELVYKKGLSKDPEEYTKNIPPHVKAALLLPAEERKKLRSIEYMITPSGPMPLSLAPLEPDYDHYLEKQIRPIAETILPYMGLTFDEICYGKQLDLF
ncbi:DNA polymerase II [Oceanispirochaeta crateris]|uniref:DNA polymerase n=1 Tax=Oceanispirochaeta crateris TaxID=2518645 RepID=A0A5C1QRG7_9SPIO|nr:DNA polymerase II [Oceanispirochaeta crateris]QEN08672.1 DNA polymerase II [Oceanispirochaeta crateris]